MERIDLLRVLREEVAPHPALEARPPPLALVRALSRRASLVAARQTWNKLLVLGVCKESSLKPDYITLLMRFKIAKSGPPHRRQAFFPKVGSFHTASFREAHRVPPTMGERRRCFQRLWFPQVNARSAAGPSKGGNFTCTPTAQAAPSPASSTPVDLSAPIRLKRGPKISQWDEELRKQTPPPTCTPVRSRLDDTLSETYEKEKKCGLSAAKGKSPSSALPFETPRSKSSTVLPELYDEPPPQGHRQFCDEFFIISTTKKYQTRTQSSHLPQILLPPDPLLVGNHYPNKIYNYEAAMKGDSENTNPFYGSSRGLGQFVDTRGVSCGGLDPKGAIGHYPRKPPMPTHCFVMSRSPVDWGGPIAPGFILSSWSAYGKQLARMLKKHSWRLQKKNYISSIQDGRLDLNLRPSRVYNTNLHGGPLYRTPTGPRLRLRKNDNCAC
ncbi:unnamed protein product [Danaus chrysippus]|uniref:(African queen) hypothetical protein n=1 Tax=Danaus chrysippus TaxID=151541 RepID=A0A8J2QPZ4_9NEOP|nr:unnamed protein product [Danaus chrysippus]